MRGEALRQTRARPAKITRQTADKGIAKRYLKVSTKADKSGHRRDKGAAKDYTKTKERTQIELTKARPQPNIELDKGLHGG